jgi:hypothetical protein
MSSTGTQQVIQPIEASQTGWLKMFFSGRAKDKEEVLLEAPFPDAS